MGRLQMRFREEAAGLRGGREVKKRRREGGREGQKRGRKG